MIAVVPRLAYRCFRCGGYGWCRTSLYRRLPGSGCEMTRPRLLPPHRECQYHYLPMHGHTVQTLLMADLNIYHVASMYSQVFQYNSFVWGMGDRKRAHRTMRDEHLISQWQLQVAALSALRSHCLDNRRRVVRFLINPWSMPTRGVPVSAVPIYPCPP